MPSGIDAKMVEGDGDRVDQPRNASYSGAASNSERGNDEASCGRLIGGVHARPMGRVHPSSSSWMTFK